MRYKDIGRHLKPYSIRARRTTTVNHAFAAAIAPCDLYDERRTRDAVQQLGQDPDVDLLCVYCGSNAETWDHVNATVRNKKFSGFGHRLGNLLPCCKPCNSKKGNRTWSDYLNSLPLDAADSARRRNLIEAYLVHYPLSDAVPDHLPEYERLQVLRTQVLEIFKEADDLAKQIREKVCGTLNLD
jgi:hypothetical protein